jgi:dihydrofolate reductase
MSKDYKNKVFIATSLDGYIADSNGGIDFLFSVSNPENDDMGYSALMKDIDAILMGRNTFEKVLSFGVEWPYPVPVFIWTSRSLQLTEELKDKVEILSGTVEDILHTIHEKGFEQLYIDGGRTIQGLLQADLIDEMTITTIPVLLGGGIPLFGALSSPLAFRCVETKHYLNSIVQGRYVRVLPG